MDGPNVNWKFFEDLLQDRSQSDPDIPKLINIGCCGLHVVHGAFKYEATATGWKLDSLLRSMWYILSESPARREDYEVIKGAQLGHSGSVEQDGWRTYQWQKGQLSSGLTYKDV